MPANQHILETFLHGILNYMPGLECKIRPDPQRYESCPFQVDFSEDNFFLQISPHISDNLCRLKLGFPIDKPHKEALFSPMLATRELVVCYSDVENFLAPYYARHYESKLSRFTHLSRDLDNQEALALKEHLLNILQLKTDMPNGSKSSNVGSEFHTSLGDKMIFIHLLKRLNSSFLEPKVVTFSVALPEDPITLKERVWYNFSLPFPIGQWENYPLILQNPKDAQTYQSYQEYKQQDRRLSQATGIEIEEELKKAKDSVFKKTLNEEDMVRMRRMQSLSDTWEARFCLEENIKRFLSDEHLLSHFPYLQALHMEMSLETNKPTQKKSKL